MHKISPDGSYVGRTYTPDHDTCMPACDGHDGFKCKPSRGGAAGGRGGGHSAGPARPFERCPGCPVNSPDQCHTPACKTRTLASRSEAEQGNVFSGGHPGGHSTGPERPRDHPPCCSGYSSDRLACSPCPNSASYLRLGAGYGGLVDAGEGAKGMVPHVHTHDEHGLNVRYR